MGSMRLFAGGGGEEEQRHGPGAHVGARARLVAADQHVLHAALLFQQPGQVIRVRFAVAVGDGYDFSLLGSGGVLVEQVGQGLKDKVAK